MPCNSDYLDPNQLERELQRTAKLIVYVHVLRNTLPPVWVVKQARERYADRDDLVPMLCELIKSMSPVERELIVYDAHDPESRDLANWWEAHQAADAAREAAEAQAAEHERLRRAAMSKLTPEEQMALGLRKVR